MLLKKFEKYFYYFILIYFFYLGICSLITFDPSWDFLSYHLPHSLLLYGQTSFIPGPILGSVMEGFHPLPHYIQGALIALSGRFSAANLINYASIFVLIIYAKKRLQFKRDQLLVLICLMLSIPLIQIHATSGYIDLWSNIPLVIAFFEYQLFRQNPLSKKSAIIIITLCGVAVFSKYLMWPLAGTISIFTIIIIYQKQGTRSALIIAAFIGLTLGYWPIRNYVKHQNPFYPVQTSIFKSEYSSGPLKASAKDQMPQLLTKTPRPLVFAYSALEISRFLSDTPLKWSIDQWAPGEQSNVHFRTGGWNIVTVLIILGLIIYFSRSSLSISLSFFGVVLITAFLPQSHELRYWLYVPLIGIMIVASSFNRFPAEKKLPLLILIAANFIWVSSQVSRRLDFKDPLDYAPSRVLEFISKSPTTETFRTCDLPYDILYAGKKANTFKIQGCY